MTAITVILAGLISGILAGILPGLGTASVMSLAFIALLMLDPLEIILFYICVLTAAQYFGSAIAILSGVPGDAAAVPASHWGFQLTKQGYGPMLLYDTAKYSLFSGVAAFAVMLVIMFSNLYWAQSLSVKYQAAFIILALFCITVVSNNRWWINLLLACSGLFIGAVGYSANYQEYFMTGGIDSLTPGIPWLPMLLGLLALPGMLELMRTKIAAMISEAQHDVKDPGLNSAAMRGGVLGFFVGTVPGLSYILSSILAANWEKRISGDPRRIVVASESANNSGAVSVLMPLLILGVPITASEGIVFLLLTANGTMQSNLEIFMQNWWIFIACFVLINLVLFYCAWKLAVPLCRMVMKHSRWFVIGIGMIALISVSWLGHYNNQLAVSLITLAVATTAGLLLRSIDWHPLIYAMLLQEYIESLFYRMTQLYF